MAETRTCEQCGRLFEPRREHARFCTARCRVAWNRENMSDPAAEISALDWSITAMRDTTERLPRVRPWDRPRAFAVIGEAVWWVTIVDGTLVRHYPQAYDGALAGLARDDRRLTEETLAGLRFVRNRMGHHVDHVDFICPGAEQPGPGESRNSASSAGATHTDDSRITAWTWKSVPEPSLESLPARGRAWEMTRYRAYQAQLAGHTIGETFDRAAVFLRLAAAGAARAPDVRSPDLSAPAAR
jgi:hypothetical protein